MDILVDRNPKRAIQEKIKDKNKRIDPLSWKSKKEAQAKKGILVDWKPEKGDPGKS